MRHAADEDLDLLEPLLACLREMPALKEKRRGVFYRKSKAFCHFHADPAGLFVDVRFLEGAEAGFVRLRVTTEPEQSDFLAAVSQALAS